MSDYRNQLMDLGILGVGDSLIVDSKKVFVHSLDTHRSLTWSCSNRRPNGFELLNKAKIDVSQSFYASVISIFEIGVDISELDKYMRRDNHE